MAVIVCADEQLFVELLARVKPSRGRVLFAASHAETLRDCREHRASVLILRTDGTSPEALGELARGARAGGIALLLVGAPTPSLRELASDVIPAAEAERVVETALALADAARAAEEFSDERTVSESREQLALLEEEVLRLRELQSSQASAFAAQLAAAQAARGSPDDVVVQRLQAAEAELAGLRGHVEPAPAGKPHSPRDEDATVRVATLPGWDALADTLPGVQRDGDRAAHDALEDLPTTPALRVSLVDEPPPVPDDSTADHLPALPGHGEPVVIIPALSPVDTGQLTSRLEAARAEESWSVSERLPLAPAPVLGGTSAPASEQPGGELPAGGAPPRAAAPLTRAGADAGADANANASADVSADAEAPAAAPAVAPRRSGHRGLLLVTLVFLAATAAAMLGLRAYRASRRAAEPERAMLARAIPLPGGSAGSHDGAVTRPREVAAPRAAGAAPGNAGPRPSAGPRPPDAGPRPEAVGSSPGSRPAASPVSTRQATQAYHLLQARRLLDGGRPKRARDHLVQALQLGDGRRVRELLSRSHEEAGELGPAIHHLEKAVTMRGGRRLQLHLGHLYLRAGKTRQACASFKVARRVAPEDTQIADLITKHCSE